MAVFQPVLGLFAFFCCITFMSGFNPEIQLPYRAISGSSTTEISVIGSTLRCNEPTYNIPASSPSGIPIPLVYLLRSPTLSDIPTPVYLTSTLTLAYLLLWYTCRMVFPPTSRHTHLPPLLDITPPPDLRPGMSSSWKGPGTKHTHPSPERDMGPGISTPLWTYRQ